MAARRFSGPDDVVATVSVAARKWGGRPGRKTAQDLEHDYRRHGLAVKNPATGAWCIAPNLEGRIVNIRAGQEGAQAQE